MAQPAMDECSRVFAACVALDRAASDDDERRADDDAEALPVARATTASLKSHLMRAFDGYAHVCITRTLHASLVEALLGDTLGRTTLSLEEFRPLHALLASRVERGEGALARLVGKQQLDLSDEWLYAERLHVRYLCPAVAARQHTALFRAGDVVDSCYALCHGFMSGKCDEDGALLVLWAEGDLIGLDDVLLRRPARTLSAVCEASLTADGDAGLARPLLLQVQAAAFAEVGPADLLHFYGGAFADAGRMAATFGAPLPNTVALAEIPASMAALEPQQELAAGSVLVAAGAELTCAYAVLRGQLKHSLHGVCGAGGLALVAEYLVPSREKRAQGTVVAVTDCTLVPLPMDRLVELVQDAAFRERLNAALVACSPSWMGHRLQRYLRGEVVASDERLLLCGLLNEQGACRSETLVSTLCAPFAGRQRTARPASRTVVVFASSKDVDVSWLCEALLHECGNSAVLLQGSALCPSLSCSYSAAAAKYPQRVRHLLCRLRLERSVCVLVVPVDATREWAAECVACADASIVVADEDVHPGDADDASHPAAVIPQSTQSALSRHVVLLHENVHGQRFLGSHLWRVRGAASGAFHHVRKTVQADVHRLWRRVSGRSLGLVLGGHAEGVAAFAYVGVLAAFRRHHVPIDVLGGSFTGAAVGAMHALSIEPKRIAMRLLKLQPVFALHDPLLELVLGVVSASYRFARRFQRSVDITFSFHASNEGPDKRTPYSVDDMEVQAFYATATHMEVATSAVLDRGLLRDVVGPALRMPTLFGGALCTGSFTNALPIQHARDLGAWKVLSARVDLPISGNVSGGWWRSWWFANNGHAALSHLAVAASRANSAAGDVRVELDDVESHEYHKAQLVAERGYQAAERMLHRLRAEEPEMLTELGILLAPEEPAPDFSYLSHLRPLRIGRYLKLGALLLLGGVGLYWLRKKAYEAEAERLEEFIRGQAAVKTEFVM